MYIIKYRHPINGTYYYFVDLRDRAGKLLPVGCFSYRRNKYATVFDSMSEALQITSYLFSLGYDANILTKE